MSTFRINLLHATLFSICAFAAVAVQEVADSANQQTQAQAFVQEFEEANFVEWEFGILIECSGGYAQSTVANGPVPIAWPEQEVELYEEKKSNNVGKIRVKKLGKTASVMGFSVPRLNNGDYAEAILRYRIKRRSTVRPDDTNQFTFAKKVKGKLRDYLKPSPYIESKDKKIREIGDQIFEDNKDQPEWDQVEAVYSWVRENVRYEFDKQIRTCTEALDSGHGDCQELTSLFVAICRSRGIPARAVWVPGHEYPEFYMEDETGKGHWFPCQIAGQNHEFGEMHEDRPILQKGDRFKIGGETKRYVEAGLKSADATAALKVEHLMRRVSND